MKQINDQFSYCRLLSIWIAIYFLAGCQKAIGPDEIKTNDALKTNSSASSKIVYTDINPDKSLQGTSLYDRKTFHLDLNNDGKTDYDIQTSQGRGPCAGHGIGGGMGLAPVSYVQVILYGTNSLGGTSAGNCIPLSAGIIINQDGLLWNGTVTQKLASYEACSQLRSGLWSGTFDKYLALRLTAGSSVYFGWLRLNVGLNGIYVIIKDYAYNSIANQSILAGQTQ